MNAKFTPKIPQTIYHTYIVYIMKEMKFPDSKDENIKNSEEKINENFLLTQNLPTI